MQTRRSQKREQDSHITLAPQSNEPPSVIADARNGDHESISPRNVVAPKAEAAVTPETRTDREQELPPKKYQKVEIPWSATLPQVVWVCDDQRFWWPGKV